MSKIAWLDYDAGAREKALQLLWAFRQKESRDELGLGTIRDALADRMFPGTSTVMTRLRYMLFVPWLFRRLEEERVYSGTFLRRADGDERSLVRVLKAKYGLEGGVIGARSGESIKRLPSDIYWAGLKVWGIRLKDLSLDEYAQGISSWYAELNAFSRARRRSREQADDLGSAEVVQGMWCADLPPIPRGFPREACFDLTRDEALFLKERIIRHCPGTLLATLASERHEVAVDAPWRLDFPEHRGLIHHAKMFALVMHGATILYNILLARHCHETLGRDDSRAWIENHETAWTNWLKMVEDVDVRGWNLDALFALTPRVPFRTREFVRRWVALAREGLDALHGSEAAAQLIRSRERNLKHERSRFVSRKALEQWNGQSGVLFTYRWNRVSRFLEDLYAGLEVE